MIDAGGGKAALAKPMHEMVISRAIRQAESREK
jgi:hypothetical protein